MDRGSQLDEDDEDDEDDKDDKEDEEDEEERRRRRTRQEEATDIKSNNPHLAGGEKRWVNMSYIYKWGVSHCRTGFTFWIVDSGQLLVG